MFNIISFRTQSRRLVALSYLPPVRGSSWPSSGETKEKYIGGVYKPPTTLINSSFEAVDDRVLIDSLALPA